MSLRPTTGLTYATTAAAVSVLSAAMILPLSFTGGVATTPAISHELGGTPLSLSWLTNGFMLTFGSALLAAGVAADLTGRKQIFLYGLGIFFFSCLLASLTSSPFIMGLMRAVQGIAAAMTLAGGSAMLAQLYEGAARTRAFSILGTMFGAGLAFGPLLSGILIEQSGWRAVYLLLALLAGLTALAGAVFLPYSVKTQAQKTDITGLFLFSSSLILFTVAMLLSPEKGFFSGVVLMFFFASLLSARLFVIRCRRVEHPVFELSLLRYPRFVGVLILPIATCYCYVVLLIILPLRFTGGEAFSAIESALYLLALTVPMLIIPTIAALLTGWFRPGSLAAVGLVVSSIGLLLLGYALQNNNHGLLIVSMSVTGAGAALPWGLMDGLAVSGVPAEKVGVAAGLFNTVRVAGESVALVIVMAFLSTANQLNLSATVTNYPADIINQAAAWLGGGNIQQAATLLPDVSRQRLWESYNHAYTLLFTLLALITLLCAFLVWKTLNSDVTSFKGSNREKNAATACKEGNKR